MFRKLAELYKDESGATAIEYALIATLIAVAIVFAANTLGLTLSNTFDSVANDLS